MTTMSRFEQLRMEVTNELASEYVKALSVKDVAERKVAVDGVSARITANTQARLDKEIAEVKAKGEQESKAVDTYKANVKAKLIGLKLPVGATGVVIRVERDDKGVPMGATCRVSFDTSNQEATMLEAFKPIWEKDLLGGFTVLSNRKSFSYHIDKGSAEPTVLLGEPKKTASTTASKGERTRGPNTPPPTGYKSWAKWRDEKLPALKGKTMSAKQIMAAADNAKVAY